MYLWAWGRSCLIKAETKRLCINVIFLQNEIGNYYNFSHLLFWKSAIFSTGEKCSFCFGHYTVEALGFGVAQLTEHPCVYPCVHLAFRDSPSYSQGHSKPSEMIFLRQLPFCVLYRNITHTFIFRNSWSIFCPSTVCRSVHLRVSSAISHEWGIEYLYDWKGIISVTSGWTEWTPELIQTVTLP